MNGKAGFLDDCGRQGLRIAGMSHVDDFAMITPVELSLISRIWPEKVNILFDFVKLVIEAVHAEKQEDIDDILAYIELGRLL